MNSVYILKCSDNTLYTGWTNDLEKRIKSHRKGTASKYTRSRLPIELVYLEFFDTKSEAMKRECKIKTMKRHKKLQLIAGSSNGLNNNLNSNEKKES